MKKSLLITMFFPPELGGIQSYLYNLVLNLPKDKIVVMTNKIKWNDKRKLAIDNALSRVTPRYATPTRVTPKIFRANFKSFWRFLHLTTFDLFLKTRKIIKKEKIEKILCGHLPLAGPLAFLIKKIYGIPYFIFTYGLEIFSIKNLNSQKQGLFKKVAAEAEKVIVITDFMKQYLEKEFVIPGNKIVKIPPGVDVNFFNLKSKIPASPAGWSNLKSTSQISNLENNKIILTCGRLVARKNHISVIRALPQIIKEIPNVLYLIAGAGPEEKNLKDAAAKLRLENHIKFLGEVPQEDLPNLYNLADIFVMPAKDIPEKGDIEGFGVVFLEAAACGIPAIAGNTGGQAEAVEDGKTGFLVSPENVDEIAAAILKILKNPELAKKLGKAGRTRIIENFNWKLQTEKLEKILT